MTPMENWIAIGIMIGIVIGWILHWLATTDKQEAKK